MQVIEGGFGKKACEDLAKNLRALAEAVDRGEVVNLVMVFVEDGEYQTHLSASIQDSIVMASLLHRVAVDKLFK